MTILEGIIQGIIQGLTEFLPVSSSGHLSVFQHFFNISEGHAIAVFLHLGTLFAVIAVFFRPLWGLVCELGLTIKDVFTGRFSFKRMDGRRRMLFMMILSCLPLLIIFPVKDYISDLAQDGDILLEGCCFLFTGVLLLLSGRMACGPGTGRTAENMRPLDAFLIGTAQAVATLPGISRSGSTISASLMLGYERNYAFDYSFILGTPAVLAATASELIDALKGGGLSDTVGGTDVAACIVGVLVAAVVGFFAIKLVGRLVRSNKFAWFGYYCLLLGAVVIVAGLIVKN